MKRKVLAILVSGITIFIWNAVSWMVLPFHSSMLHTIPDSAVEVILNEGLPSDRGVYHYPGLDDPNLTQKIEVGPRIPLMVYYPEGTSAFNPIDFIKSLLFNLLSATLLFLLLSKMSDISTSGILKVSVVLSLLIGTMSELPQTSWYLFPIEFAVVNMLDYLISLILAGLLIKKIGLTIST